MTDQTEAVEQTEPADREAAKYRKKLREAETERDTLTERLDLLRRAQADSMIEARGMKPNAIWANGTELAELLGDDGNLDPERIAAAVEAASNDLGIKPKQRRNGLDGLSSGAMRSAPPTNNWRGAFAPDPG